MICPQAHVPMIEGEIPQSWDMVIQTVYSDISSRGFPAQEGGNGFLVEPMTITQTLEKPVSESKK